MGEGANDTAIGVRMNVADPAARPFTVVSDRGKRPLRVVQAGSAVSSRTRRGVPNPVNLVRREPAAKQTLCRIERWDYAETPRGFIRSGTARFTPHQSAHDLR